MTGDLRMYRKRHLRIGVIGHAVMSVGVSLAFVAGIAPVSAFAPQTVSETCDEDVAAVADAQAVGDATVDTSADAMAEAVDETTGDATVTAASASTQSASSLDADSVAVSDVEVPLTLTASGNVDDPDAGLDAVPTTSEAQVLTDDFELTATAANSTPSRVPLTRVEQTTDGIMLQWKKGSDNKGYVIYRKAFDPSKTDEIDTHDATVTVSALKNDGYTRVAKLPYATQLQWTDTDVEADMVYVYCLYTYNINSDTGSAIWSAEHATMTMYVVPSPTVKKLSRSSGKTSATFTWSKTAGVTGYQVQWSTKSIFSTKSTYQVRSASTTSYTAKGLTKSSTYYARVRSYVTYDGSTYYSPWSCSSNACTTSALKVSRVKKSNGSTLELRALTGQSLYSYDTLQGSCSDGTYAYYAMYNRNVEKCRIAKVRVSDNKLIKVSKALPIGHGNDMTWNSETDKIVVVYTSSAKPMQVNVVDPDTLTVDRSVTVSPKKGLAGATNAQVSAINKLSSISYNAKRDQYVVVLGSSHNLMILDGDFNAVSYIKVSKKIDQVLQGMVTTDDYIMVCESASSSGQGNILMVYDWEGTYIKRFTIPVSYEFESAYFVGNTLYLGFYRSYYDSGKGKTIRDNYLYKVKATTL